MKKIVSLAIACMLVLSCFAINAFAAATEFTVNVALVEGDIYSATFNSPVTAQNAKLTFFYDSALVLLDANKEEVVGSSAGTAFDMIINCDLDKQGSKAYEGFAQAYAYRSDPSYFGNGDIFTLYFKKVGEITANPFSLNDAKSAYYGGLTVMGETSSVTYRVSKDTATVVWNWEALKSEVIDTPVVELGDAAEELASADYAAASAADKGTLTFVAKVSAEKLNEAYGVIVAGKKFFGAPASSIADPDFVWDGSFEIVLNNITEKGTAGEKSFQYFVGDAVTNSATVNVVAE